MRRAKFAIPAFIILLALLGCQGSYYKTLPPELVPLAKYDEAITSLVAVKRSFNNHVKVQPDPAVRKQMLEIADPLFDRVDSALKVWKAAVDDKQDPAAKIKTYNAAWLELVNALMQMGVVEVR
jgi:hypothetical protein